MLVPSATITSSADLHPAVEPRPSSRPMRSLPDVPSSRRLTSQVEGALRKSLLDHPNQLLFSLLTEGPSERRQSTTTWLRRQPQFEVDKDEQIFRWLEVHRMELLREIFLELESLRSYKATTNEQIRDAVEYINTASSPSSWKFSHH